MSAPSTLPKSDSTCSEHLEPPLVAFVARRRLRVFRLAYPRSARRTDRNRRPESRRLPRRRRGRQFARSSANRTLRIADLMGHLRAERGELHAAHRQVAVVQQKARPRMAAFLAGHRADDGDVIHHARTLRQRLGDLDSRDAGRDGFGLAAVFVARLGAERLELARSAAHPQQDAGHATLA